MSSRRPRKHIVLIASALAALTLLALAAPALAKRPYESQLTEAGAPLAPLTNPWGLATDPSDNLWVSDTGTSRVSKFDSAGAFLAQADGSGSWSTSSFIQGLAYGNSANLLYVADSNFDDIWGIEANGVFSGTDFFGGAWDSGPHGGCCFIRDAVDNSGAGTDGDIYVSGSSAVTRIDPSGAPANFSSGEPYVSANRITGTPGHSFGSTDALATDSAGNLYVADNGHSEVDKFAPTGAFLKAFGGSLGSVSALAVDPTNGHLLIADTSGNVVREFDSSGASVGQVSGIPTPAGSFAGPKGLAVDSSGRLYVSDSGHAVVDAFAPFVPGTPPAVTIEDASQVKYVTAHVQGTVDRQGEATAWRFEYATQADFSDAATGLQGTLAAGGPGPQTVEGELTGLANNTTYHLRLIAVNDDGNDEAEAPDTFTTEAVAAPSVTTPIVNGLGATSTHFEAEVDPNAPGPEPQDEAFDTHWEFKCTPSCTGLTAGTVKADDSPHPVEGNVASLQPSTPYTVTLIAKSLGGEVEASESFETDAVKPSIALPGGAGLSETTAHLHVYVNPYNAALSDCHIEYGTDTGYGQSTPCSPDPGSAGEATATGADLSGLDPETTYHFQVKATNVAGESTSDDAQFTTEGPEAPEESCPNEALRNGPSARLPNCRAYEQVSPVDKNGADVIPSATRTRSSTDGNRVTFASMTGFGDTQGMGVSSEYMSMRAPDGTWSTHGITPIQDYTGWFGLFLNEANFKNVSPDLGSGVVDTRSPLTNAPNVENALNLYLRTDLTSAGPGSYTLLTDSVEPQLASNVNNGYARPYFVGASEDFSRIYFESPRRLTADAPPCSENPEQCPYLLYEWAGGQLHVAGVLPASEGGEVAPNSLSAAKERGKTDVSVSADGTRAAFVVPTAGVYQGALYLRDDQGTLDTADDTTVRIDAPETEAPLSGPSTYWGASEDLSKTVFTNGGNLYMYDLDAAPDHHLTLLSVDSEPSDGSGQVRGIAAASDDGSYVYFVTSQNQLIAGAPTGTAGGATLGGNSLGDQRIYVWHEGTLHEVGAVNHGAEINNILEQEAGGDVGGSAKGASRLTPDGTHFIFISEGTDELLSLHGREEVDHGTECPSNTTPQCSEVYAYDATANGGAGDLRCASCDPSGAAATFDARYGGNFDGQGLSPGGNYINHPLSSDGRFVFFNTEARLLEEDTNAVSDAYEYDTATGQLHLISTGTGDVSSAFLAASADGRDAFFTTREHLRGTDVDQSRDLYDARIDGGQVEPVTPALCDPTSGQCQGTPAGPPPAAAPPSAALSGPGNQVVKRHRPKHRKHRHKSHKKKSSAQRRAANKNHGGAK